jgi:hypothetical protein
MLLLCGKGGRSLLTALVVVAVVVSVSVRLRLPNFEGGGGRDPIGRVLFVRRSLR